MSRLNRKKKDRIVKAEIEKDTITIRVACYGVDWIRYTDEYVNRMDFAILLGSWLADMNMAVGYLNKKDGDGFKKLFLAVFENMVQQYEKMSTEDERVKMSISTKPIGITVNLKKDLLNRNGVMCKLRYWSQGFSDIYELSKEGNFKRMNYILAVVSGDMVNTVGSVTSKGELESFAKEKKSEQR